MEVESSKLELVILLLAEPVSKLALSAALVFATPTLIKSKPTQVQKGKAPMGPSKNTSKLALTINEIKIQVIACSFKLSFLLNSGLINKNIQYSQSINKGMPYLAMMVK